ncbi:hypothetical protein [Actinomadura sp. 7K507]|uniref:hypothetical protein n=1 Tax=Actinomadura sp. 7K507 TaxID=2530365 RepID=UPI001045B6A4|nr:hypothetical protein [Actinomadura sp. 7K507]TDC72852.1 hypothetical protein E1285_44995 [Actinomadura sp. 7K507]
MQFKIEMTGLRCLVADAPEQRRDFESKDLRTDAEGRPLFQVRLLVMDGEQSAPIKVGVVGDPGLSQGAFVVPVGLALNAIDRRGDTVMWWTAERLESAPMPGGTGPGASGPGASGGASGKAAGKAAE